MNVDGVHEKIRNRAVRHGTGDIAVEPAMSREECIRAIEEGIRITEELREQGYDLIITGEMGIGNTTTSSACAAVLFHRQPEEVTGRGGGALQPGTGEKDTGHPAGHRGKPAGSEDPIDIMAKVGGLDIAGMTGCFLGAAACRMPVWIDGFISGISACFAARLEPLAKEYMVATHCSAEPGGKMALDDLGLEPLLYAGMHLGEATGAAAMLPLLDQALNVYYGLPSFASGKVEAYQHLK